ncbi:chemotaxis signal transduction protein [Halalkalibacter wakoensis JCM 9140]|uniref:Chemotaxis signal transduction protein n=1 Tax=Halalkalibacter wakoensis JCM 9140 TaxID=1236970 RepID=W4Q3Q7_9BACI|nr:chemotaxis protein CheW [Halalkalibacter wakoensis]GAE25984.1 chemotaxis signal transduction protein [Halalkalibacter wakoensis JCM 9140]
MTEHRRGEQFVVFSVNQQLYSLSIEEVVEILRVPTITSVPGINEMIEGVINLRGSIIPVISLHKRFDLKVPKKHKKNRVVIVQGESENIGLIVEEVRMVTKFEEENVEPTPGQTLKEEIFNGFAKLDGQVIGILDLKKVLYEFEQVG